MAQLLDGKLVAREMQNQLRAEVEELAARGIVPGLAVVSVGIDDAGRSYIRGKERSAGRLGLNYRHVDLPVDSTTEEVTDMVEELAADPRFSGIIVQLPLPSQVDVEAVQEAIPPAMDVDGLTPANLGALVSGGRCFAPCTPAGIIDLLDHYQIPIEGRQALVIGRSTIVGKPMAHLLLDRHATVTIAHSRTRQLKELSIKADIIVVAVGRAGVLTGEMVWPDAVVIDVGMNKVDGKLVGDAVFSELDHAAWVTPVPGGVGPLTVSRLMRNTVEAARRRREHCG